jgi:hypothetical protein
MLFRAYLRTFDGAVSDKTITGDPQAALAAFAALVNRADLDGQKRAAALTGDNRQLAFHRFDRNPGDADYWRDRLGEIEMPGFGKIERGGAREGAGRPATGNVRVVLRMSPAHADILKRLGGSMWVQDQIDATTPD